MSAYHRLISYIYAYEGGIKGKNTGFAKLETRGTSCRIQVSVRRVFAGGSPIGVYLLAGQEEIRIGTLFVRGGNGEFRAVVNCENIEGIEYVTTNQNEALKEKNKINKKRPHII